MDDLGWPSRHRRGCAPGQLRGVERCILLAQRRLARKCDEVMGDKADANHVLDPALAQERLRQTPEGAAVVRHERGAEQQVREDPRGLAQVRP
jgi:hypothetical protein